MTNFQIYKASAGSGKTYSLVKEYIKRALSNPDKISHKSLLAITFTNKAASEMKTRIIDSLFHFSNGQRIKDISCQTMYRDLKLELGYNDDQLTKRSKTVLSAILHYYSFFFSFYKLKCNYRFNELPFLDENGFVFDFGGSNPGLDLIP